MVFANPWGLLALLGIPVILYCHRRSAGVRQAVPFIGLWQPGPSPNGQRARRMLLDVILLLRLLMVVCLAFALARPSWAASMAGRSVFLLDASASMSAQDTGGPRFEQAIRSAGRILDRLPADAEVAIIRAGTPPRVVQGLSRDRSVLRAALASLALGAGSKDLAAAFALARRELGDLRGVVHVFSDLPQSQDIVRLAERVGIIEHDLQVHRVGGRADNLGIIRLEAAPLAQSPLDYEVLAVAANYAQGPREVEVALRLPQGVTERRRLTLAPGAQQAVPFTVPAVSWVEVGLEGNQDALSIDDRAALALPTERRRILYASRGNRFVGAALRAHPQIRVQQVPLQAFREQPRAVGADAAVVDGWTPPRGFPLPALTFAPPDPGAAGPSRLVPVVDWNRTHPLLRQLDLSEVLVPAGAIFPPGDGEPLIRSADGVIARLTVVDGVPRLECAFAADRSNIGSSAVFPILVARALDWLTDRQAGAVNLRVGQPLRISRPDLHGDFTIHRPDGSRLQVAADRGSVAFAGTDLPGVYTLEGPELQLPFAVRLVDAAESNLDQAPARPEEPQAAASGTGRTDGSRLFLAIALPALSIEAWLLQRQRRRARP
jgi:hypothetical protein